MIVKIIILAALAFVLILTYACCTVASRSDEEAARMFEEHQLKELKKKMDSTPVQLFPLDPIETADWIPTEVRDPDPPTGPEYFYFDGVDIAADEYIVMIYGATEPTAAYWTGSCWFDPYGPGEDTYKVIAWRPFPDPPSWALPDQLFEEDELPFPEVLP